MNKGLERAGKFLTIMVILALILGAYVGYTKDVFKSNTMADLELEREETSTIDQNNNVIVPVVISTEKTDKVVVFLDHNRNLQRDGDERVCDICVGKVLNAATYSDTITESDYETLVQATIEGSGLISPELLHGKNTAWGFYADRQVLIPNFSLVSGQTGTTLEIPAWETLSHVSGTNAGIARFVESNKDKYLLEFDKLVPVLMSTIDTENETWVYVVPDASNPDLGYLRKIEVKYNESKSRYYAEFDLITTSDNALEKSNLQIIVLDSTPTQ